MYKNDKILITGGTGFVGHHLIKELSHRGYSNFVPLGKKECNLMNETEVHKLFKKEKPNIIIHLAAKCGGIGANKESQGDFFYHNMKMGLNIIHEAFLCDIKKFVFVSTICAYPKFTDVPFKENDLWKGFPEKTNSAYAIAKKSLMVMLEAYYDQYAFESVVLMPTNLYGPYDNFDLQTSHVIPALIRKFLDAKDGKNAYVECWGDGVCTRDFLYVEDAVKGIIDALEKCNIPMPINLGSGLEITIKLLAEEIKKLCGFKGEIRWNKSLPNGQPRRCLDISHADCILDWQPKISISEGLKETIKWYQQIRRY